jgi:hypothetical protein
MSERSDHPSGPSTRCRLCGRDAFAYGLPYEHRPRRYDDVEWALDAVVRLCRPCADDFITEDERDDYLERLIAA